MPTKNIKRTPTAQKIAIVCKNTYTDVNIRIRAVIQNIDLRKPAILKYMGSFNISIAALNCGPTKEQNTHIIDLLSQTPNMKELHFLCNYKVRGYSRIIQDRINCYFSEFCERER